MLEILHVTKLTIATSSPKIGLFCTGDQSMYHNLKHMFYNNSKRWGGEMLLNIHMSQVKSYPYFLAATCYVSSLVLSQKLSKPVHKVLSGGRGLFFCVSHHILQRVERIRSNLSKLAIIGPPANRHFAGGLMVT